MKNYANDLMIRAIILLSLYSRVVNVKEDVMQSIRVEELQSKLRNQEVILIDVREPGEYQTECIAEATHIPLGEISVDKLPRQDKPIVIHCRSGARSQKACEKLLQQNPELQLYSLEGGIVAWQQHGGAIKRGGRRVMPLDRQAQIVMGALILLGLLLGVFVAPVWLLLSALIGAGLLQAGITGWCGMVKLMAKMPWNH